MRKIYNPVTLTYSLDDAAADLDAIISTTCAGLQKLMRDEYRFLAGSVHEDSTTGHSFAKRTSAQSRFPVHINDLRHGVVPEFPSYAALAARHFPVAALEDPRLLPASFTPFPSPPADGSGIPATLVQLNLIRGGLIIGLAINHRLVDARGLDAIVARWAAHTRALFDPHVHVPPPPFDHAALDRSPLNWAARTAARGEKKVDWREPAVPSMRCLPDGAPTGPGVKPEDMASRIWHVSASKLAELKARASVAEGGGGGGGGGEEDGDDAWVSTNDCLTALMWRCITRARLARHGIDAAACAADTRPVKLMNAIDIRAYVPTTPAATAASSSFDSDDSGYSGSGSNTDASDSDSDSGHRRIPSSNAIGIPDAYPGNTVMFSHATLPLNTLLAPSPSPSPSSPSPSSVSPDPSFRHVARAVRSAISHYRHPSTLRSALSWIASCPRGGVGTVEMDFDVVLGLDVVATSWRVLRAYERADFGWSSDGGLKALRWAAPLFDGYCFFYPTRVASAKGLDEGVEVYLGLERRCMERLVEDEELRAWAEVRGE